MRTEDILINVALLAFFGIGFYTLACGAYFLYYRYHRAVPARVWAKIPVTIKAIGGVSVAVLVVCLLLASVFAGAH